MKKKKAKFSTMQVYLLVGLNPLILTMIIVFFAVVAETRSNLNEQTKTRLEAVCSDAEYYFGFDWEEWMESGELSTSDLEYVDLHQNKNIDVTIFKGDTRYISSILSEKGERIIGTKAGDEVIEKVLKRGEELFVTDIKINDKDYLAYYKPIHCNGEIVGMAFAGETTETVNSALQNLIVKLLIRFVVVALTFVVVVIVMAWFIKKSRGDLVKGMKELADGKLDAKINTHSMIKEMDDIIECAEVLKTTLNDTVGRIKSTSDELYTEVKEVSELSAKSSNGADKINIAVGELVASSTNVADSTQNINGKVIEIGDNISDIAMRVERLSESSDTIKQINSEAMKCMETVRKSSEKSAEAIGTINTQVSDTNKSIEKINDAVALILDITDQTKLLSLNASIEAARAGEAGKGFAVVADSIRQLSEQSMNGANLIDELAKEIIHKSDASVQLTEEIRQVIIDEQEKITVTQEQFNILSSEIEKSLEEIDGINTKTEYLANDKETIIDSVQDLSAVSEENAAANEEVAVNVTNITEAISDISEKANQIRGMAEELENAVAYFK